MASIKSVPANSWQACDVFSNDTWGQEMLGSVTGIKAGASGASTDDYWSDIDDGWYQGGYPEGTATWSGKNGINHYAVRQFGASSETGNSPSCRYLTGHMVTAVQVFENNNSTAKSGLYLQRAALGIVSSHGTREWYDLFGKMNRPTGYGRVLSATFNSTFLNRLKDGWYIDKFMVLITSAPSGTARTTQTTVQDLKFKTAGTSGHNLILPVKRSYSDRAYTNRISS